MGMAELGLQGPEPPSSTNSGQLTVKENTKKKKKKNLRKLMVGRLSHGEVSRGAHAMALKAHKDLRPGWTPPACSVTDRAPCEPPCSPR